MEWFTGGVGEAIAAAKAKKAIFAVFVKGKQLVTPIVYECKAHTRIIQANLMRKLR